MKLSVRGIVLGMFMVLLAYIVYFNLRSMAFMKDINNELLMISSSKNFENQLSKREKAYSILPEKIFSVIGLESSGTNFVTSLIRDALNQSEYREGDFQYENPDNNYLNVQVQHFSLPQGSTCHDFKANNVPVLDVVLPAVCTDRKSYEKTANKEAKVHPECGEIANDLWGFPRSSKFIRYPSRYLLDIASHKSWYEEHGVEQYFIIVMRDENISRKARSKEHCKNSKKLLMEEEIGKGIIIDAINKYILEENDEQKKITKENFDFWNSTISHHQKGTTRRKLSSSETILPSKNNVVIVSYESLMLFKEVYVSMLFKALGIEADGFQPEFKDGNRKYLENIAEVKGRIS